MASNCDKCGTEVEYNNDATIFDALLFDPTLRDSSILILFSFSRHLLPVIEGDTIICEGSPSRAQYFEGQPRDARTQWDYEPEQEGRMREAYDLLQKEAEIAGALTQ
jgi:hypothetical protein